MRGFGRKRKVVDENSWQSRQLHWHFQGNIMKAADCVDHTEQLMQGVGWLCGTHCWGCLGLDCHEFRMPLQLHALCVIHTASNFPPLVSCEATLTVFAARCSTAWQDRTGQSWASNDFPFTDLSNTRALKHLAPLATDYWADSHSFVEV
jgi:hypothetical protein